MDQARGDGTQDDFGRGRETGLNSDRYHFRTPSLLNVAATAPYGHAGAYESLNEVLQHYNNPRGQVNDFFDSGGVCQLDQFDQLAECENLYPFAEDNTSMALERLQQERAAGTTLFEDPNLNAAERASIVAFLQALTDPCIVNRECLAPWIPTPEDASDGHQLNAIDADDQPL